jgi:hypothetical protein
MSSSSSNINKHNKKGNLTKLNPLFFKLAKKNKKISHLET